MKVHVLTLFLIVIMLHDIFGKIVNGYEEDAKKARISIAHLRQLLADHPHYSRKERRILNATIKDLTDFLIYHQLTDTLLLKFREVAPDLYAQIDTLRDHRHRVVDVYVRFISPDNANIAFGSTRVSMTTDSTEMCTSQYGRGTVAVNVCIVANALAILSHEFGHLQYMVPNIREYARYYQHAYGSGSSVIEAGHDKTDASGRHALRFEGRFRQRYHTYLKREQTKSMLPHTYLAGVRKRLEQEHRYADWRLAATDIPVAAP